MHVDGEGTQFTLREPVAGGALLAPDRAGRVRRKVRQTADGHHCARGGEDVLVLVDDLGADPKSDAVDELPSGGRQQRRRVEAQRRVRVERIHQVPELARDAVGSCGADIEDER